MKTFLKAVVGVVALAGAANALADTDYYLFSGTNVIASTNPLDETPLVVGDYGYSQNTVSGAFTDTFSFMLSANSVFASSANNLPLTLTIGQTTNSIYNVAGMTATLFDTTTSSATAFTWDPSLSAFTFNGPLLASDNYYVAVSGNGNGSGGGLYQFSYAVSAVPEPSITALMFLGLAMVGITLRGRSRRDGQKLG